MDITRPDTLEPGNLGRFLPIGKPAQMTFSGACGGEDPFEFNAGYDVR